MRQKLIRFLCLTMIWYNGKYNLPQKTETIIGDMFQLSLKDLQQLYTVYDYISKNKMIKLFHMIRKE